MLVGLRLYDHCCLWIYITDQKMIQVSHFSSISLPITSNHRWYLNFWTNHLDETIKYTSPFSLKRFPLEKTFIDCKCCNRLSLTESYVFHNTVDKSINTLLWKKYQVTALNEAHLLRRTGVKGKSTASARNTLRCCVWRSQGIWSRYYSNFNLWPQDHSR